MNNIPLTKLQKDIMEEFYNIRATKVIFNKTQRRNKIRISSVLSCHNIGKSNKR